VSFVNAPDTPDPVVGFVPERDQIKPDLPLLSIGRRPLEALDTMEALEGSAQR
jgi:nitrite reductase (NADH) large subunit